MSVVVRMEMPKGCLDCPCANGEYGYCQADKEERQIEDPNERPSWCPIICSLPEGHGRLVDEKEVKDWVENWLCVNKYYHPYSSSKSIPVSELYDVLQRMDAAVQAEAERSEWYGVLCDIDPQRILDKLGVRA